jgi:O-antigen/teichoic acid export membrane protein
VIVVPDDSHTMKRRVPGAALERVLSKLRGSQFNRNMGAGSIMALVGSCLSIVSYPIYLHYLGYHRFGLWLVLSVVVSVAQLGNLGIPWALMKLVAEDHAHEDWEGVRTYINIGCGIILGVGLVFCCGVILMRGHIVHWFKLSGADGAMVQSMLPYVAMLSVLVLLFSTFNASLGGLGRIDLTSYNETLVQVFVIIFSGLLLYLGFDMPGMVFGTLFGYVVAQVISFVQVQTIMPVPLIARTRISRLKARQLLSTGGWIMSSGIFTATFIPFTRLMLSRFAGMEAITVNEICLTGSMRVRSIFDSAIRPMMPEVSNLRVKGKGRLVDHIRRMDRKAFLVIFSAALPVFTLLFLAMNPLLHIWLHKSFNPALPNTFRIALIGAFASLLGSSAYYMLIGLGRAQDAAYSAAIQFAVNAAILPAIAFNGGQITVGQAATAFGVAVTCATLYLRLRIFIFTRSKDGGLNSLDRRGAEANG